jgi:predicted GIY-YIG superfamily endonuclease
MWKVYLLQDTQKQKTYVGATMDIHRRLLQHNQVQSGGAKATHGRQWNRVCHVVGFPHQRSALQFEWKWKNLSKKESGSALARRIKALMILLCSDQSTSKAVDYKEYVDSLEVIWEDPRNVVDVV